ncbi:MAG TPA: hypothetical protein HA262_03615 [Methanosarcina sp.]|nr:hypothetical protein [Methanosarcina sp.]
MTSFWIRLSPAGVDDSVEFADGCVHPDSKTQATRIVIINNFVMYFINRPQCYGMANRQYPSVHK